MLGTLIFSAACFVFGVLLGATVVAQLRKGQATVPGAASTGNFPKEAAPGTTGASIGTKLVDKKPDQS